MNEERDKLTQHIAQRLGDRQHKLEQMEQWEKRIRKARLRPLWLALAAACLAGVMLWAPWQSPDRSDAAAVREASQQMQNLMGNMSAQEKAAFIDLEISRIDSNINLLKTGRLDKDTRHRLKVEKLKKKDFQQMQKKLW